MTDKTYTEKEVQIAKIDSGIVTLKLVLAYFKDPHFEGDIDAIRQEIAALLLIDKLSLRVLDGPLSREEAMKFFDEVAKEYF